MALTSSSESFAPWPSGPVTLSLDLVGLACRRRLEDLFLPKAVLQDVLLVTRDLRAHEIDAIWLSGSSTRGHLRRHSDIDWVVVTNEDLHLADWPTRRHSFQIYKSDIFLRSLSAGHEFSVWQLAYGYPIYIDEPFFNK